MTDTATSPDTHRTDATRAVELDRLSILVLGRLSLKTRPKKAISQRQLTTDVARVAGRTGTAIEWQSRVAVLLEQLVGAGLVERKPLQLTAAGREALRRGVGSTEVPTWEALPGLLAGRALGLEPSSSAARSATRTTDSLSAAILARRFGTADGRSLSSVIDEVVANEIEIAPGQLNTERLRARVLARRLGLPERPTVEAVVDGIILQDLGLPAGKVDWKKLRKALLARRGGTTTSGDPAQIAARIAAATVRSSRAGKKALLAALTQRWLDGTPIAAAETAASAPLDAAPPMEAAAFVAHVHEAARAIDGAGRFGDRRVFVSALWRRLARPDAPLAGIALDAFKGRLLEANRDGALTLVRADLVDAMEPAAVAESEIRDLGSSFHFVLDRSRV